jgi:hypothetical protein
MTATLRRRGDVSRVEIAGYRDPEETSAVAELRAQAVRDALVARGVAPARLSVKARSSRPRAADEHGRGVEFWIAERGGKAVAVEQQLSLHSGSDAALGEASDLPAFVTLSVHPELAATPEGEAALRAAELACRDCDGLWGPHGRAGYPSCYCKTADGGRFCRESSECEAYCELPYAESFQYESVGCADASCSDASLTGRCSEYRRVHGCRAWIEREDARGQPRLVVRRLCVD